MDVQVEKQTAGVLTDEPSWGQQLTVRSPEGVWLRLKAQQAVVL